MMSGGGGGGSGLRYFLHDSAEGQDQNPRVIKDEFGLVRDGYEIENQEDGYRLADRLRDELEQSQELAEPDFDYLYQSDWMAVHPDEAEELTDEDWIELAEDYVEKMGWEDHDWMLVAHDHTDHQDRHLIVDRYDHENDQTLDVDWVQYNRMEAQRELEQEHDLIQVDPHDRERIGQSVQKLRPRMEDRGFEDELYRFIEAKIEQEVIQSKGDFQAILDEARLETEDHGNYVTGIHPDTGGRERVGEDDIEAIDWTNPEVEAYRESVIESPELVRHDPVQQIVDVMEDREGVAVAQATEARKQDHDPEDVAEAFTTRDEVARTFEEIEQEQKQEFQEAEEQEPDQTPEQGYGGMEP